MIGRSSPSTTTKTAAATLMLAAAGTFAAGLPAQEPAPPGPGAGGLESRIVTPPGPGRGSAPPDFQLMTLDGEVVSRESLAGTVVLLDFWASWCAPCVQALPHLKALQESFAGQPFRLLGVSVDEDRAKLEEFLLRYDVTWPQHWDHDQQLARTFRVPNFPTYILLDHQGRVAYSTYGWTPTMGRLLDYRVRTAVARALQARSPSGQ